MTQAFKFFYSDIQIKVNEYSTQIEAKGNEPMAQFVRSILSIVANKNGYKKFGVYWFAIKDVLKQYSKLGLGYYSVDWLATEYALAQDAEGNSKKMTPMMILVAGYEFAINEGYLGGSISMPPPDEYDIDGNMWGVVDEDMINYKG